MNTNKAKMRSFIFYHLDGIALIPTVLTLGKNNILDELSEEKISLSSLSKKFSASEGYLNVALRLLCCQGWLSQDFQNDDIFFKTNESIDLVNVYNTYKIIEPLFLEEFNYDHFLHLNEKEKSEKEMTLFNIINKYLLHRNKILTTENQKLNLEKHIEGIILGPILVYLSRKGLLSITNLKDLKINENWKSLLQNLFSILNITNKENNSITEFGQFLFKRSSAYGVTVSYLPTFRKLEELIFKNPNILWEKKENAAEIHVDRKMNVWGSGGAHKLYFQKVDEIIINLFNLPIEQQPKGFIDIGCGDGSLIEHIFDLIYYKTKRGELLKDFPLVIIGSDFNYKALEVTKENIKNADIWANTAFGDIGNPKELAKKIKKEYNVDLEDLLNVRSFLDHNRIYKKPKNKNILTSNSQCSFSFRGKRIKNEVLSQNLYEHFSDWKPYLKKYGLLIVELHSINPQKTKENLGKNSMTAYDATHGYSDQYIIEYENYLIEAKRAGLEPEKKHEHLFPNKEIPIVSVNRLICK